MITHTPNPKTRFAPYGLALAVLVLSGCETVYQSAQSHQRNQCYELPQPEYEACMKNTEQSYNDYEKQRDEQTGK